MTSLNEMRRDHDQCLPIVHHQQFKLLDIMHNELLESIRKIVTGLLVSTITNVWHQSASFELSSNTRINTLWSTPVCLSTHI